MLAIPQASLASPRKAEKYTHIAGFNLADYYSFAALARKFGKSKIVSTGDGAESDSRVCYRTSNGKRVVIFFSGEINQGFTVRYPTRTDARCPMAHSLTQAQTRIAGIELGMSKARYLRTVGRPSKVTPHSVSHTFQYVHRLTDKELKAQLGDYCKNGCSKEDIEGLRNWDVGIWLNAAFTHGRLTSFTVNRAEQN